MTQCPRGARRLASLLGLLVLAACATPPAEDAPIGASPWALASQPADKLSPTTWAHHRLPGKQATEFRYARKDGRDTLAVLASSSASMVRTNVRIEPKDLGQVRFSWKVPELMELADLAVRERDDGSVRLILAFEGDRSRFSARDAALSELARALTGEEMPYATLMYVWCNRRPVGTVIPGIRTDRIRKLVVQSGPTDLNRWLDYERDVRADFERAFGEKPGALVGIAIMTDSDNTRSKAQAWYGPVRFSASAGATPLAAPPVASP